ncbi:MAG: protein kinase [Pirellulales bacterium]|nr:protein kinase [Pirellulales bacterium]
MSDERTQYQTAGGQSASQKLSMEATTPPAEVPGYRLQRFLGSGAFGQVWVGRDLNTGRGVAVKFYLHRGGVNWSLLSREVKNLVQLSADRHVVQVLEVGWDADPPYYVMELVGGGSLEDLLRGGQPMSVNESVEMFRKICVGLNHCHGKGVLHCDLKPANILLGEDNEPRLADFGQSRMSDDQTPTLGTLFYMAPEQADLQSTPDASWDVYAAGAILFRLLTGQPPYRKDSIVEQLDTAGSLPKRLERYRTAIKRSHPPDEHLQRRDVDRALGRIISRCLAPDPEDRYANVQQILQDLNRRDESRLRRSLTLLGIVGPILVLIATCVFAARSIRRAERSTVSALRTEAFGSNQLAATFAASSLESEVERYFALAREEAQMKDLVRQVGLTLGNSEVSGALDEIAAMRVPAQTHGDTAARDRLLAEPVRKKLDQILADCLKQYKDSSPGSRDLRLATMFVTDPRGTIISVAFHDPVDRSNNTVGMNFCYRTYFHGGRQELSKHSPLIGNTDPLTATHLSATFQSLATGLWKVAVSTPIYLDDDHREPDALFVITINLGDFKLLQSKQSSNQVAVLVQAREGPERGTILQHPLMDARREVGQTLANEKYQLPNPLLDQLLDGGDVDYLDPMAEAKDGSAYAGPWIAAMQKVAVPSVRSQNGSVPPSGNNNTDLLVLVQYRLETVMEPVAQMRSALMLEGAAAIGSIMMITLTLWLFVRRVGAAPNGREESAPKSTDLAETITVP